MRFASQARSTPVSREANPNRETVPYGRNEKHTAFSFGSGCQNQDLVPLLARSGPYRLFSFGCIRIISPTRFLTVSSNPANGGLSFLTAVGPGLHQ